MVVEAIKTVHAFDVKEKSIAQLQAALESGEVTSVELVDYYLQRIHQYDKKGPCINSLIMVNDKALDEAKLLDEERKEKGARGPLHGIPVILKDNYDTFDMPTTAGSVTLKDSFPPQDATITKQLRDAGAIFIAKANMHEYAYGISTISSLGGQTFNPYQLNRHPGGSSGGTGAAIAANFAAIGMGTDTGCSIRNPSSYNNLVGLRPSYGLTSRAGIIPISSTQDVGGPMGRTVEDVAIVMDVISGEFDERDSITKLGVGKAPESYTEYLTADALQGAKIGVLNQYFGTSELTMPTTKVVKEALAQMEGAGATLVEMEIENLKEIAALNISSYEFKKALNDYLSTLSNPPVSSLEDILESGQITPAIVKELTLGQNLDMEDEAYQKALEQREAFREKVEALMDALGIDVIAYPTFQSPPPLIGTEYREFNNGALSAVSGLPAISVPAGFTEDGLPVGIEFAGRLYGEAALIQLAYAFEQLTKHRTAPPTTP